MNTPPVVLRTLPGFNGVAAGQPATLTLPVSNIYHQVRVNYGTSTGGGPSQANMEAEIEEVRIKVNGKVQRVFSAQQLFDINAYHGMSFAVGVLPIYFAEPWRATTQAEDALRWGMADVQTFQIEIDIAAGAVSPTLSATALIEPGNLPMGAIVKWKRYSVTTGAAGVHNMVNMDKFDAYYGLHANTALITEVDIKVDGEEIVDATRADLTDLYSQYGFTMPADWFVTDFGFRGRVGDALAMMDQDRKRVQDFRVDFTVTGAGTFDLITETLGLRD